MTLFRTRFLRAFCNEFGAFAPESFWKASDVELTVACNGVGPERWPCGMRKLCSWLLRPLEASAAIHDWEYSQPDKSFRAFSAANARLAANVMLEALYDCRPACMLMGIAAALACQFFGWSAYKNGRTSPPPNQSAALRTDAKGVPNSAMFQEDSKENMK